MSEPDINNLDKTVAVLKQIIEDGFKSNTTEHESLKDLIIDIETKKAGKWVEKVMIAILTAIGMAFCYGVIDLVIK